MTEARGTSTTGLLIGGDFAGRLIDLTGQRFGRLVVMERAENDRNKNPRWKCRCDCGKETVVLGHLLRTGNTRSCGCFAREEKSKLMKKYVLKEESNHLDI